ncbi:16S rRNA (guanine(966)-N(2))-methyltransferase RsmD [Trichothermofontia sp.]
MALRIAGKRALKTAVGLETRPTSAKVRAALFNIWQGRIADRDGLDICAGSGAIGAEALSRGARRVVGIEQSVRACRVIQANWQAIATTDQVFTLLKGHALHILPKLQGQVFDWIYFDPPYASGLYDAVLTAIVTYQLLSLQGELAVEYNPQVWQPQPMVGGPGAGLSLCRQKQYGSTAIGFYQIANSLV